MPNELPLNVVAARVALSPKPSKEERRPSTAALISKIPFLQRSGSFSNEQNRDFDRTSHNADAFPSFHGSHDDPAQSRRNQNPVLAEVLDAQGGLRSRRKSSLRKTVLQTTGRIQLDRRTSKEQVPQRSPTSLAHTSSPSSPRTSTTSPTLQRQEREATARVNNRSPTERRTKTPTSPTKTQPSPELPRSTTSFSNDSYPDSLLNRSASPPWSSISPTDLRSSDRPIYNDDDTSTVLSMVASTIEPDDSASVVAERAQARALASASASAPPDPPDRDAMSELNLAARLPEPAISKSASISPPLASPATLRPPRTVPRPPSSPSPPSSDLSVPPDSPSISSLPPRRRSTKASLPGPSPLTAQPTIDSLPLLSPTTSPSETWDYSSTSWWGYVILLSTWLVFVVGMGSCFGVWSWAWDVGTTPYAPPEFEDDPTLPIVGYYPSLMVLTGVMSWVWVTVAWVGLKYFKHAKIGSED